jgi:ribonucleotide reductase alpha subunit
MYVIKRNGQREPMRYDKITDRNVELANGLNVDVAKLSQAVIQSLKDGMTTEEIDQLSAETAFYMSTYEPDFDILSARIAVSNLHKTTSSHYGDICQSLFKEGLFHKDLNEFVQTHANRIQAALDFSKDYEYNYFGFKTLERAYLLRIGKRIVERPQHMLMRVSVCIHGPRDGQHGNIDKIIDCYKLMSRGLFTHASPTLFNAGSNREQLLSCFLIHMKDDLRHIYETNLRCGMISKHAGGIGIDITSVRAKGSLIKSTNGKSDGIVPMIQMFNASCRYANQCFVPETIVYTKNGQRQIQDVIIGDEVITMDGTFKSVANIIRNEFSGELLSIRTMYSFEEVRVTKVHQIYVLRNQTKNTNFDVIKNRLNKNIIKPEFASAEDLNINDMIGYPLPILLENDQYDTLGNDFFRFYGIMLGDGHICRNRQEAGITVNETSKINTLLFIRSYLKNKNIHFWETTGQNCINIKWTSSSFNIRYDDMYDDTHSKRVHDKYTNISRPHIIHLVKGLLETDGSNLKEVYFTSTSYKLVHNIRYFLNMLGIMSSGFIKDERGKTHEIRPGEFITNQKISYIVRISKHPILNEIVNVAVPGMFCKYFVHNNIVWSRIKSITPSEYNGSVYDLSIIDNNNYVVASLGLVHNSGKRKGSFAMYLQPWHPDIFEFLGLRLNVPPEELRARDVFLALWIPDIFMKRVEEDGMWSLICPSTEPRLCETYGEEFEQIYLQCEKEKKYNKQVPAREVWKSILYSQIETGMPYMLYKDAINRKSMQKNIGIIRSSNLCVHGDTQLITKNGRVPIKDLAGKETEIWNGFEWTKVTPSLTGSNQKLIHFIFSNGSDVMMTPYHNIPLLDGNIDEGRSGTRMIKASDASPGDMLTWWINIKERSTRKDGTIEWDKKLVMDVSISHIEEVPGEHDTYCFTDAKRGLGVFNGVLLGNCAEIVEYTDGESIANCTLSSISLPKMVETTSGKPSINWELLGQTVEQVVENLDLIIDLNYYPVEEAKKNNLSYRPIGLGCQGLADVFCLFHCTWGSEIGRWISRILSEVIYYHALKKSAQLAQQKGSYSAFEGSPISQGKLQYHLWNEVDKTDNILPWTSSDHPMRKQCPEGFTFPTLDWSSLIEDCKKGMRNSLLVCQMPTASTSQILGNNEALEPFTSNIYTRSVLSGDFVIVNKYLYRDLKSIGLWNKDIVDQILEGDGSIQHIEQIPQDIRDIYKTVWEISQRTIIDLAAERGPFIDQTQSMNLFMNHPTNSKLSSMHMHAWKLGLKTGMYYLRSTAAKKAVQFSILKESKSKTPEIAPKKKIVCTDEICTVCSG